MPPPLGAAAAGRRPRFAGLWRHADFLKLWTGQTVSQFGSTVTREALPLTALTVLGATPVQMGLLAALAGAPVLLLGLVAGVWADRVRRRPLMIGADLGRAALLGSVPLAAQLGHARIDTTTISTRLTNTERRRDADRVPW
jgi:MFS family permease